MELQEGKEKAKQYYDQEAGKYLERYDEACREDPTSYPANIIRLDIIVDLLRQRRAKTLLDAGAGSGGPMVRLLQEGFQTKGFDFAPKMVDVGKEELKKLGYNPDILFLADLEDASTLPQEQYDAVLALAARGESRARSSRNRW